MRKTLVLTTVALLAGAAAANAVPAAATTTTGILKAHPNVSCTELKSASKDGRVIILWKCAGYGLHGELIQSSPGDLAYMKDTNGNTAGGARVPAGSRQVNTGDVTGTWVACGEPANNAYHFCTGYGTS